jgi:hypothetical protein
LIKTAADPNSMRAVFAPRDWTPATRRIANPNETSAASTAVSEALLKIPEMRLGKDSAFGELMYDSVYDESAFKTSEKP